MSRMPPIPPKNRSNKGAGTPKKIVLPEATPEDRKHHDADEQGETANIHQNTTNKGVLHGRRMK